MKTTKFILFLILSNFLLAQNNFELKIKSANHLKDSILIGTSQARAGFEDFYQFNLETNKNVFDYAKAKNFPISTFGIIINGENKVVGKVNYPIPVSFSFIDFKKRIFQVSKPFFIEKGKYETNLPSLANFPEIEIKSPTNSEYKNIRQILNAVYVSVEKPFPHDSLTDFNKKQELLANYIKKNQNSYVALWEIINDYTLYNYNPIYLGNMKLFSKEFKTNTLYKKFQSKLLAEKQTNIGYKIPNIYLDKKHSLTEKDFKKYKLTFIDYWSTSCGPCIKSMPEIVILYKEFKDKNVNFISITDENKIDRMKMAEEILKKNNATWTNYFDINKDFSKKVNATSYPLQFIVDSNGKILARIVGDLDEVKKVLNENLK